MHADSRAYRLAGRHSYTQTGELTDWQADIHTCRQESLQIGRKTFIQAGRIAYRLTGRHSYTQTGELTH